MLTEEQLEIYGGVLVPVFQQLEQDIIADIARRVRKEERWTETAELQAEELRRLGWSPYRIRIEVMRRLQANKEYAAMVERNTLEAKAAQQAAIDEAREALREQAPELFETVGNMAFRNDLSLWEQAGQRLTRGGAVDRAVREMRKRATGDILNLTRTMGFSLPTGSVPARRAFTAALNSALTQAVSGTVSYQQACANAVRLLTQSGLRHIDYKNGVTRQIDTAVRNAVLTASAQLSGEIMQANIEESGVAYVQVSAHWGARDSHAVWQGKVYSLAEFRSVCGYGEPSNPDHIYSYNCRHTHYPYWPGISEPVEYPPEPGPFEADGKTYTYYQATQRQRAMERSIRAMKRDALAQDAMGDKGALAAAKIRLDEKTAAYKRFSAQVNMRPRLERTQVFGYDRGAAARARSAVEKELAKAPAALQSSTMRDIIGMGDDRLAAEIEIEIDRFTPCLVDRKTGMRVATTYTFASKSDLANLRRKGWIFNWTGDDLKGADIYKLRLKGDTEIQGLIALREFRSDAAVYIQLAESAPFNIGKNKRYDGVGGHLFAIAAKKSADAGYGGFLFLDAKNMDLVEHYKMAFGARHIGGVHPYRMLIDEENAMKLLKIYNFEEG